MMQGGGLKRSGFLKQKPLNRKGPKATLWEQFRGKKLLRDLNGNETIVCQDYRIGLPRCGLSSPSPDLHHILGRDARPDLYFDDKNLVWLVRACHELSHSNTSSPRTKAQDDAARQVGKATSG